MNIPVVGRTAMFKITDRNYKIRISLISLLKGSDILVILSGMARSLDFGYFRDTVVNKYHTP